ncbi:MAG: hypothetical protein JXP73_10995 [Deltaproteobacteria bacterium]|nr:hypothetical protein [Deltaproteobacteria bacterium]
MEARILLAWALAVLCASCFSPKYHDGNLHCTASGQCPEGYHCAVDHTCWRNGSDPDAGARIADSGPPDTPVSPEAGAEARDAAEPLADGPATPDLSAAMEAAVAEVPSLPDATPPPDLPLGQDVGGRDVVDLGVIDAPATDVALPVDAYQDGGPDPDAGYTGQLDKLAEEYACAVCNRNFACCTPSDTKGKTKASCQQSIANLFKSAVDAVTDGVNRGRTIYYPERAQECLRTIEATKCEDWPLDPVTELPAICASSIEPQIGNGGPCRTVADCVSGLCIGATSSADGTCMRKVASGQTCEPPPLGQNTCEPEFYCDSAKTCSATKNDGTSCGGNLECKSLTCGPAPDAGNLCLPATCYSNGPLIVPACSFGGRPSAFAGGLVLATLALLVRRRRPRRRD